MVDGYDVGRGSFHRYNIAVRVVIGAQNFHSHSGRMAKQAGVRLVIHYLDDFLIVGAPASPECAEALRILLAIFKRLGLPVAMGKLEGPVMCLDFLGFELDTHALEVRLPQRKLVEIRTLVDMWKGRKTCTKAELESLTGKLAFAARVVQPGKTFLGRLYQLLGGMRQGHHRLRPSSNRGMESAC